jgi:AsmA protein
MKPLKWVAIIIGGLVVLVIGALLIIPLLIDMGVYKGEIEKRVAAATGRPFAIEGDLKLSLFPWAGLALSDLRLGNPPGFAEKNMLSVKSFDVQVRLMPLLSKDIQVKRFVVEGVRVVLETRKDGKTNWEGLGGPPAAAPEKEKEKERGAEGQRFDLPIRSLAVGEMALRKGNLLWIDEASGERREVKDLGLELKDVSLDRPIRLTLSANLDGNMLVADGKVGPLGTDWGKKSIPLHLSVNAFKDLSLNISGSVSDALEQPKFDVTMEAAPFSPKKIANVLGQALPATSDPNALEKAGFKSRLKGDASSLSLTDGIMDLDQSRITFSAAARDFTKPDLNLKMNIDQIDLDRYLPPAEKEPSGDKAPSQGPPGEKQKKTDYGPLRRLVLDAEIRAGKIKVMGAQAQDLLMKLKGRGGVFHVEPFGLKAYEGTLAIKADLDVRADRPKTSVDMDATRLRIRPLLNDLLKKDFLEGTGEVKLSLRMEGEDPDSMKRSMNGSGDLRLRDGAIIGIDLPGMVRNVKAAFGGERPAEKPKTDFSEMIAPFTIEDGVVHTTETRMASPLMRVVATGKADLVKETLDMRVEPSVVGTLKGQQDPKERSGIMIPVLVTGTFDSPSFAPDLKGMLETEIKERLKSPEGLKDILRGERPQEGKPPATQEEKAPAKPEDKAKEVLKGLFGK